MWKYTAKVSFIALSWVPVVMTVTENVAHFGRIEGISMKPALNPDSSLGWTDFVFLWKYRIRDPGQLNVGDVVLLRSPRTPTRSWSSASWASRKTKSSQDPIPRPIATVPRNHLWVEGDNLFHSVDSNTFGPVSAGLVIAKATHVIFPFSRFGPISSIGAREARLDELKQVANDRSNNN